MIDLKHCAVYLTALSPNHNVQTGISTFSQDEWDRFWQWAGHHRILPILANTLLHVQIPEDIDQRLKTVASETVARNLALKGLAKSVEHELETSGVRCLPFKGPCLAEEFYGSASARDCYDIDMMICQEDYEQAAAVLQSLGFSNTAPDAPKAGWLAYRYEECYKHNDTDRFLELHWRFMPNFIPFNITVPDALSVSDKDRYPAGHSYLPRHMLFILLAAHGYRHYWYQLCWVSDIIQLMKDDSVNWESLAETAKTFNVERITRLAMEVAARIPGVVIPDCSLPPLCPQSHAMIDDIVSSWATCPESVPVNYRYIRHFLDTFYQRQLCLKRLTFQPTLADFDYVSLPSYLSWLYPAVRVVRLLTRN